MLGCILSLKLSRHIKLKVVKVLFTKRKVDELTIAANHDNEECICWIPGDFLSREDGGNTVRGGRAQEADRARRPPGAQGRPHPRRPRRGRARPPHPHRRGARLPKNRARGRFEGGSRSSTASAEFHRGPRGDLRDHDFGMAATTSWRAACPERQNSRRRRDHAGDPWRLRTKFSARLGCSIGHRGTKARFWPDPPKTTPGPHWSQSPH